jgi:hypothetical protein
VLVLAGLVKYSDDATVTFEGNQHNNHGRRRLLTTLQNVGILYICRFHARESTATSIADNLSKAGWSCGCVATVDHEGRTIFVADAHRDDGKRFVVHADEKLAAFLELERAVCIQLLSEQCR